MSTEPQLIPPADAAELETWVNSLSIKQLKTFITSQGMQYSDCVERDDLRARAKQAAANFVASENVDRVHIDENVQHEVGAAVIRI